MTLAKVVTGSLNGVNGRKVTVEVDQCKGFPTYNLVGLAGTSVKESVYRVKSAITKSGLTYPVGRVTINLAPSDLHKEGSHMDLAIAIGLLASMNHLPPKALEGVGVIGQLSLDGQVTRVKGALPLAIAMWEEGIRKVVVPRTNKEEVAMIEGMKVYPVDNLSQVVGFFKGTRTIYEFKCKERKLESTFDIDYRHVLGQEEAKRAMVICGAGSHGLLMTGSPGVGKTMLAKRLPTILPDLDWKEGLEVTKIHSAAGLLDQDNQIVTRRPFRSPNSTITKTGLLGGGYFPVPGEVSLAHRGVLFLDEVGLFDKRVIDCLGKPLEEGFVTVNRKGGSTNMPSQFVFLAATNPCRCGFLQDPTKKCTCTPGELARYRTILSEPMLNRIDLHINLYMKEGQYTYQNVEGESLSSMEMKKMVEIAVAIQRERYKTKEFSNNSQIPDSMVKKYCVLDVKAADILEKAMDALGLSMRTRVKTIKISRTIADLEESEKIKEWHVAEALKYRKESLDKPRGGLG